MTGKTNAVVVLGGGGTGGGVDLNNVNAYPIDFTAPDSIMIYIGELDTTSRVIRGGQEG